MKDTKDIESTTADNRATRQPLRLRTRTLKVLSVRTGVVAGQPPQPITQDNCGQPTVSA